MQVQAADGGKPGKTQRQVLGLVVRHAVDDGDVQGLGRCGLETALALPPLAGCRIDQGEVAQFQAGQEISPDALRAVVTRIKGDIPLEIVKGSQANILERGRQALTEKGQAIDIAGQKLREKELEARGKETAVSGNKDAAAVMKAFVPRVMPATP